MIRQAEAPVAGRLRQSSVGLVLLDSSRRVLFANREAVRILMYPNMPRTIRSLDHRVGNRIRSQLRVDGAHSTLISGKRRYLCRAFSLASDSTDGRTKGTFQPSIAALLERNDRLVLEIALITKQYRLTRREGETLELLTHGLTSREMATRMSISRNTVKTFMRLLMVKMGVSTRSEVIGRIFDEVRSEGVVPVTR